MVYYYIRNAGEKCLKYDRYPKQHWLVLLLIFCFSFWYMHILKSSFAVKISIAKLQIIALLIEWKIVTLHIYLLYLYRKKKTRWMKQKWNNVPGPIKFTDKVNRKVLFEERKTRQITNGIASLWVWRTKSLWIFYQSHLFLMTQRLIFGMFSTDFPILYLCQGFVDLLPTKQYFNYNLSKKKHCIKSTYLFHLFDKQKVHAILQLNKLFSKCPITLLTNNVFI